MLQAAILLGFSPTAYQSDWIMRKDTQNKPSIYGAYSVIVSGVWQRV